MNFNLQALDGFAPGALHIKVQDTTLSFYRSAVGSYEYYGYGHYSALQLKALPGMSQKSSKFTLQDVYRAMDAYQGAIDRPYYRGVEEGYLDLLEAQFEYFRGSSWQAEGQRAAAEFEALVTPLLHTLSTNELLGMKVRQLENPRVCHAVSKSKQGVFIWPSWHNEGTVHLVMRVDPPVRAQVRAQLETWLAAHHLKLEIPTEF